MDERRRKGFCYWCAEKYTSNHCCKESHVFTLMVDEDDEKFEDALNEGVLGETIGTINAIEGPKKTLTLKILGHIKDQQVVILIDTGSTHNVIDADVAKSLKLESHRRIGVKLQVADDCQVWVTNHCFDLNSEMGGYVFNDDLLVMKLQGYDMILGTQWLKPLGRFIMDMELKLFEFKSNGQTVELRGLGYQEQSIATFISIIILLWSFLQIWYKVEKDHKITPRLERTESDRVGKLEKLSHYGLYKLADDFLRKVKDCRTSIYEYFATKTGAEYIYELLTLEFEKYILIYLLFRWNQASAVISQTLSNESEKKTKILVAARRKQRFGRVIKDLKVTGVFSKLLMIKVNSYWGVKLLNATTFMLLKCLFVDLKMLLRMVSPIYNSNFVTLLPLHLQPLPSLRARMFFRGEVFDI